MKEVVYEEELANARRAKDRAKYLANRDKNLANKKVYYARNKDLLKKKKKDYYEKNRELIINKKKLEYLSLDKMVLKDRRSKAYQKYKPAILNRVKEYAIRNKDKVALRRSIYVEKERANINARRKSQYAQETPEAKALRASKNKEYREANKKRLQEIKRQNKLHRRKSDPVYAMKHRMRARLAHAFSYMGYVKGRTSEKLIGCSWESLKMHIESKFTEGMSWENRSEWHVDHIIPLASAHTEAEAIALFHYSNLQPLWASDNIRKGHRI